MQDRFLQGTFTNIVVEWGPGYPEKQGERAPVVFYVRDRLPETGVRLNLPFGDLFLEPGLELYRQRSSFGLVESQTLLGRQAALLRESIVFIYLAESFQNVSAFLRESRRQIDEIPYGQNTRTN